MAFSFDVGNSDKPQPQEKPFNFSWCIVFFGINE